MSEKKVVRRRKVRRKKKQKTIDKKIWMIIGGVIAGLVIVYLAISVFFMSHFYINTQINGKNFSGKNAAAVENYIKNQVADYKLTIVEQNNMTDAIEGSDISLVYKENSDIEDALKKHFCGHRHFSQKVQLKSQLRSDMMKRRWSQRLNPYRL